MEEEPRTVLLAAASDRIKNLGDQSADSGEKPLEGSEDRVKMYKAYTHCGLKRHDDRGCWTVLTCQKCGRKVYPLDRCLHVCSACGEIQDCGKCPIEEFHVLIRQWYVPSKHAGIARPSFKNLNKDDRQV